MILTEFDPEKRAVMSAADIVRPVEGFPETAVTCFSHVTLERLTEALGAVEIARTGTANMELPVYEASYKGRKIALFMSCAGASSCAAMLEDVFMLGAQRIVMFGTCGVLDASIEDCSVIIPTAALRDEGTSFHYAPASDEIAVNKKYREEFREILERFRCKYTEGKVWTTDGIYRETREKVRRRKEAGCICVDMECSAAAAVAQFCGKEIFQFFYAADNLDGETWDKRSLGNRENLTEKDRVAMLAMELAYVLAKR